MDCLPAKVYKKLTNRGMVPDSYFSYFAEEEVELQPYNQSVYEKRTPYIFHGWYRGRYCAGYFGR